LRKFLLCLIFSCYPIWDAYPQKGWSFEYLLGDAFIIPTSLTVKQNGYEDIKLIPKYRRDSFEQPLYYSIKLSKGNGKSAWEIELLHLKIFLDNKPEEIQQFGISHGYNYVYFNRVWEKRQFIVRLGLGLIVAHAENTVRERKLAENGGIFNAGYYISGSAVQGTVANRLRLIAGAYLGIEGKLTISYSRIPVADGHANAPLVAFHGLFGLGYQF
jgi:hypothetical protein